MPGIDLFSLEINNLIAIMNKMTPISFARLRRTEKSINLFVDHHQSLLGVLVDNRIDFNHRDKLEISVDRKPKRFSPAEAMKAFSGFSFGHVCFNFNLDTVNMSDENSSQLMEFLRSRIWRQAYLSLNNTRKDILELIRPKWLFTTIPLTKLQDGSYLTWFNEILNVSQLERLIYGITGCREAKILELVLEKWCAGTLGSLYYVVPGINFSFCNVENWETDQMVAKIQQRHMKTVFEILNKFLGDEQYSISKEIYEENRLPDERFTENVEFTYKPIGIIKIHVKKGNRIGCLAVEITQYLEKDFNVSFCFYTKKEAVEEYERRMAELLS